MITSLKLLATNISLTRQIDGSKNLLRRRWGSGRLRGASIPTASPTGPRGRRDHVPWSGRGEVCRHGGRVCVAADLARAPPGVRFRSCPRMPRLWSPRRAAVSTPKASGLPAAARLGLSAWGPCPLSPRRRLGGGRVAPSPLALRFLFWGWGSLAARFCSWPRSLLSPACLRRRPAIRLSWRG